MKKFARYKTKFIRAFAGDNGRRLSEMIQQSVGVEQMWEIPKGRLCPGESFLECATREFSEECNIREDQITVINPNKPFVDTHTDHGITYHNIYYVAIAAPSASPHINFSFVQMSEIDSIRWIRPPEVEFLANTNVSKASLKKMIKVAKNHTHQRTSAERAKK